MKMVFLPELSDIQLGWVKVLRQRFEDVNIVTPATRERALAALQDADAAFGTLDEALLAAASELLINYIKYCRFANTVWT